jgi:hypothetical protein
MREKLFRALYTQHLRRYDDTHYAEDLAVWAYNYAKIAERTYADMESVYDVTVAPPVSSGTGTPRVPLTGGQCGSCGVGIL